MMELHVQNYVPGTPGTWHKEPQFGFTGGLQTATPNGNALEGCYPVVMDGWRIHHNAANGAWIRQGTVIWRNGEFSDSPRGFTYPTAVCDGQWQEIHDMTFHGFTENVGDPEGDIFDFMGNMITPPPLSTPVMFANWQKGPDGVWRTRPFGVHFPDRGINVYDTFVPTLHYNLRFFDFPYSCSNCVEKFSSGLGFHLKNQFGMTVDEGESWNCTYHNTPRKFRVFNLDFFFST